MTFTLATRHKPFAAISLNIALLTMLFVAVWSGGVCAQPPAFPEEFANSITNWNAALERIDHALNEDSISSQALEAARGKLDDLRTEITRFLDDLRPRADAARQQAEKLGTPPGAGQPAEPDAVVRQRAEISKTLADLAAAEKAAEAGLVRVKDLTGRTRDIRREMFERRVLQRVMSPLSLKLWTDLRADAPDGFTRLTLVLGDWWHRTTDKPQFLLVVLLSLGLWGALLLAIRPWVQRHREWNDETPPTAWHRSASAAWVILVRAVPPTGGIALFYFWLTSADYMPPPAMALILPAAKALAIIAAVQAVARTVLAVNRPSWRLVALPDKAAGMLYQRLMLLAGLYALDMFVGSLSQIASMPYSLAVAQSFIASVGIAALIISILRIRAKTLVENDNDPHAVRVSPLRLPLWLIAFAILGAALTGYVSLARFISGQLIVTSMVVIVAYLFLIWAGAFGQSLADSRAITGRWLAAQGLSQRRCEQLGLPVSLLLKGIVIAIAVPCVLLMWGFDAYDVAEWAKMLLFGFEIGKTRISLSLFVAAALIFVFAFAAARAFQTWLDNHVMAAAGVECSVRDSVRMGVGYLGTAIAVLAAASYAGFDLSSLAIVAGAVSVGLGFGLQSVVNNFVSGLILLAERPIKVGDWIVVGTDEGIVRRISVRATEIETFERSNVIIPNSQLISQTVKNWTLHNNTGRMAIAIGVHYDSDPEEVRDILLKVANAHPEVLPQPEPFVYFEDFADSSLKFVLYVYLSNVAKSISVRTDLRMAILKVFRARGIEIPFPQTDVHLSDLRWIKRAIAQRLAAGAQGDGVTLAVQENGAGSQPAAPGNLDGKRGNHEDHGGEATVVQPAHASRHANG